LRCLSCRQLLRQCLDAFALGLRRLSLSPKLILHPLPRTDRLLFSDRLTLGDELLLHAILYGSGHLLLLLPGSGFELCGLPFIRFLLGTDRLLLGGKGVSLGTEPLLILSSYSGDQRCGKGLGKCNGSAAFGAAQRWFDVQGHA